MFFLGEAGWFFCEGRISDLSDMAEGSVLKSFT